MKICVIITIHVMAVLVQLLTKLSHLSIPPVRILQEVSDKIKLYEKFPNTEKESAAEIQ